MKSVKHMTQLVWSMTWCLKLYLYNDNCVRLRAVAVILYESVCHIPQPGVAWPYEGDTLRHSTCMGITHCPHILFYITV